MDLNSFKALPVPDLTGVEYCTICEHPLKDQELGGCAYCEQQKKNDKEKLNGWIEAIGGRRPWEDYTQARWQLTPYNKAGLDAARGFNPRTQNLFFHGPRGTGKSHAASIAKRPLITGGFRVRTVSMPNIADTILAGIKSGTYAGLVKEWLDILVGTPVLNIEDLGVEKPSEHMLTFIFKFIDGRYVAKRNGMIITCNYSLDDLENRWAVTDSPGRITSRLREMCRGGVVSFAGSPDWRANEKA
jgi:DNA replication protein DnaC